MALPVVVLSTVLFGTILSVGYCLITGISPISSSRRSRREILSLIPAGTTGRIVDLGSGWGGLVYPIARRFSSCRVVGYELSPMPWLFSLARGLLHPGRDVRLHRRNFLDVDLRGTTVVVCYLYSELLEKARSKLEAELAPGTLVISNTFDIPGWQAEEVRRLDDSFCPEVYVYRVPDLLRDETRPAAEEPALAA